MDFEKWIVQLRALLCFDHHQFFLGGVCSLNSILLLDVDVDIDIGFVLMTSAGLAACWSTQTLTSSLFGFGFVDPVFVSFVLGIKLDAEFEFLVLQVLFVDATGDSLPQFTITVHY